MQLLPTSTFHREGVKAPSIPPTNRHKPVRIVRRSGKIEVDRLGFPKSWDSDFLHRILGRGWPVLMVLVLAMGIFLLTPVARTESAQKLKSNEEEMRQQMLQLTKELGTTCTECHNVANFKDSSKHSFQIAAQHLKLVAVMKENGLDGKKGPEANCFMCHRGELHPPSKAK